MTIASLTYHSVSVNPVRHLLRYQCFSVLQESCYPYWPTDQGLTRNYGEIGVTLKSEEKYHAYIVRKFEIIEDKSKSTAVSKHIQCCIFIRAMFPCCSSILIGNKGAFLIHCDPVSAAVLAKT